MKRKTGVTSLLFFVLVVLRVASAQQTGKVYRIGYLSVRPGMERRDEVFRQRLRELGYVEGKNLIIEWRFTSG